MGTAPLPSGPELERLLESVECAQYEDFFAALPNRVAEEQEVGLHLDRWGFRITARAFDHPMFNRVMSAGLEPEAPSLEEILDRAAEHYRAAGIRRWMLQVLPHVEAESFREAAGRRGIVRLRGWNKHLGSSAEEISADTDLRVVRIGEPEAGGVERAPELARAWAEIVVENFELPEAFVPWLQQLDEREGWRLYLALDGEQPVATAGLFVAAGEPGRFGHLTFAATQRSHRGRGAQSALIARRVGDARRLGVPWIVSETDEPRPGGKNPSTDNLTRYGFPVIYVRANWGPPKVIPGQH